PATPKGDVKTVEKSEGTGTDSQQGKMVPTKEGTESQPGFEMGAPEKSEHAKTVERTEGTDSQEGKMVPTKEGN
ncbi:alpha-ketoglutarate permease, partial [Bacillus cereus]